ncbi:response regulator [Noviherbaspirillum galbum]|uniref:Response regulator n=1 Tax=Noviherbaspirillum galbum TaxID=2709383 RepID=A0A6B3SN28_9BURK|nr:response regulator [Noviherbaspirillum galbum]NEX62131.1 response regulator [Noviherbaspirillum galbum]
MTPRSILIVEDDKDLRESLLDLLVIEGFSVVAAGNGEEALQVLRKGGSFGLVLLDIMMPVMDGVAFMHAFENEFPHLIGTTPIVVLSVLAGQVHLPDWVTDAVAKPTSLDKLVELCERCFYTLH